MEEGAEVGKEEVKEPVFRVVKDNEDWEVGGIKVWEDSCMVELEVELPPPPLMWKKSIVE